MIKVDDKMVMNQSAISLTVDGKKLPNDEKNLYLNVQVLIKC